MNDRWRDEERDGYGRGRDWRADRRQGDARWIERGGQQGQGNGGGPAGYSRNEGYRGERHPSAYYTNQHERDREPYGARQDQDRQPYRGSAEGPGWGAWGREPETLRREGEPAQRAFDFGGYERDYGRPEQGPGQRSQGRYAEGGFERGRPFEPESQDRGERLARGRQDYLPEGPNRHEPRGHEDRSWWSRTRDEVNSWFGDDQAERRRRMDADHDGRPDDPRQNDTAWNDRMSDQRRIDQERDMRHRQERSWDMRDHGSRDPDQREFGQRDRRWGDRGQDDHGRIVRGSEERGSQARGPQDRGWEGRGRDDQNRDERRDPDRWTRDQW